MTWLAMGSLVDRKGKDRQEGHCKTGRGAYLELYME